MKNHSTFVTTITCFDQEERLDVETQRKHFRRLAQAGVGVYVGGGGTGEGYTLTRDEWKSLLQVAVEELKGKVPARVMGVEPRSANEMIEMAKLVEPYALDGLQIYSLDMGHSGAPNEREKEKYFRDIFSVVKIPSIVSTHQSVGWYVYPRLMKRLVDDYPQIIGVNVTHPDVRFVAEMVEAVGNKVEVHVGGPMQALTILAQGGNGFISSEASLAPRTAVSIIDYFKKGDLANCFGRFGLYDRMRWKLSKCGSDNPNGYAQGNTRGIKAALRLLGLPGGYARRPRLDVPPADLEALAKWLNEMDELRQIEGFPKVSR